MMNFFFWRYVQSWKHYIQNHPIMVIKVMRFLRWLEFWNKVIRVIRVIENFEYIFVMTVHTRYFSDEFCVGSWTLGWQERR